MQNIINSNQTNIKHSQKILICIDDTDDLTKETSTGLIASQIAKELQLQGAKIISGISRHQLLLHEKIAYTSHNSSMCIELITPDIKHHLFNNPEKLWQRAKIIIQKNMAKTANPGLAICWLKQVQQPEKLIDFGFTAKEKVLTKLDALKTAYNVHGIRLDELGGDGSGIIGALAGLGLRLSRCDGTIRGKTGKEWQGQNKTVKELCEKFELDSIVDQQDQELAFNTLVHIDKFAKLAFISGNLCIVVKKLNSQNQNEPSSYVACFKRQDIEKVNAGFNNLYNCPHFELDNDEEECLMADVNACYNCLYRRFTANGFICQYHNI